MIDSVAVLDDVSSAWGGPISRACWQGGLMIMLVWAACRVLTKIPPAAKCWLWRLAYLKLFVALLWATPIALPLLPAPSASSTPTLITEESDVPASPAVVVGGSEGSSRANRAETVRISTAARHHPTPSVAGWALVAWALGSGWCAVSVVRKWRKVRHLCSTSWQLTDQRLEAWVARSCRRFGLRRPPVLKISDAVGSPVLLGVIRPAVVLPSSLMGDCTAAELRIALSHEIAHLKRRDLAWNWLPTLAEVLFFFHPFVWLARRQWRLAQELACDEMAVRASRASAAELGSLLIKVASRFRSRRSVSLLTAEVSESFSLIERRLVAMKRFDPFPRKRKTAVAVVVALLVGVGGVVPWRVTAAERQLTDKNPKSTAVLSEKRRARRARREKKDAMGDSLSEQRYSVRPHTRADKGQPPALIYGNWKQGAVVDITYLFKHHKGLAASMANFKKEVEAAEARMKSERRHVEKLVERLAGVPAGSSARRSLEAEVAARRADLTTRLQLQRKRFLHEEAGIYDAVYREIVREVARYAKEHGIRMVVRRDTERNKLDPQKETDRVDPHSVLARINRAVVYHEEQLDITLPVLAELNREATRPEESPQGQSDLPAGTDP